ncbi:hypothetical protein LJC22_07370 [Desulfosarcina sp. OttesenSCG-928-G10]|nr:hypothetical protein [Desulfosarcina sp. OttesenSCG-928-G10]
MPATPHTIATIHLHCTHAAPCGDFSSATAKADQLSSEILDKCRETLPKMLERILDSIAGPEEIISIDHLSLDLGDIRLENLADELEEKLEKEMTQLLTHKSHHSKKEDHFMEILMHYLSTGFSPWNAAGWSAGEWSGKLEKILNTASARSFLETWLKDPAQKEVRKRFSALMEGLKLENPVNLITGKEDHPSASSQNAEEDAISTGNSSPNKIFVEDSGLVLISPFLPHFFSHLGLLGENKAFISEKTASIAVFSLKQILFSKNPLVVDGDCVLGKILCGLEPESPLSFIPPSAEKEKIMGEIPRLLDAVISHWAAFGNTGRQTFVDSFLKRRGVLHMKNALELHVEHRPHDLLLQSLPWVISIIQTPWMKSPMQVIWS